MAEITAKLVKELREKSGAGVMDAKKALVETDGDIDKAIELLREKGMAKAAKKLYEENLRYSNGEPVKVVISNTTIGRVGETAACADQFRKEGVDIPEGILTIEELVNALCQ